MKFAIALAAVFSIAAGAARAAHSPLLGPLNDAANALLSAAGVSQTQASAVVPVTGSGGEARGYAQVAGPESRVREVRAVLEIESPQTARWRITALVPVSSVTRSGTSRRVPGVAVDALVDYGS